MFQCIALHFDVTVCVVWCGVVVQLCLSLDNLNIWTCQTFPNCDCLATWFSHGSKTATVHRDAFSHSGRTVCRCCLLPYVNCADSLQHPRHKNTSKACEAHKSQDVYHLPPTFSCRCPRACVLSLCLRAAVRTRKHDELRRVRGVRALVCRSHQNSPVRHRGHASPRLKAIPAQTGSQGAPKETHACTGCPRPLHS